MAVGTVSGLNTDDPWQLISTATPSAATTTTFSSISGYKKLRIVYSLTPTLDAVQGFYLQFNGDSTAGNYGSIAVMYTSNNKRAGDRIYISGYTEPVASAGFATISDTDKTTPKTLTEFASMGASSASGIWLGSSAVTSVLFGLSGGTYTGTIYLYGVAA
jgi:hypothetical protein